MKWAVMDTSLTVGHILATFREAGVSLSNWENNAGQRLFQTVIFEILCQLGVD